MCLLAVDARPARAADPVVAVWYRGTPAGTPRQEELAVIRALGFGGIAWPAAQTSTLAALKMMAEKAGPAGGRRRRAEASDRGIGSVDK